MHYEKLPFDIVDADQKTLEAFPNVKAAGLTFDKGCLVGPKRYFLSPFYRKYGLDIYNFQARSDDVYLVGYFRSGTTLHCEMTWLIGNNLDYETARSKIIDVRFPHIDSNILKKSNDSSFKTFDDINNQKHQRFLKAHLPLSLLPPSIFNNGSKVIYCARNPKDVIVSSYHANKLFTKNVDFNFPDYFRLVKLNWGWFLPYFEHVKEAWQRRHDKNFLFLFYEDTMKDKSITIRKVAEFLNVTLTEVQISNLLEHLDIENFKKNKSVNLDYLKEAGAISKDGDFIRKGEIGDWRQYFVGDLEEEVDNWIMENLKGTDLVYPGM